MSRQFRIRVYGQQRHNIDPALLTQVVILLGRHLHHHQQQRRGLATGHPKANNQGGRSLRHLGKPAQAEPDVNDMPTSNWDSGSEAAGGGGSS